MARFYVTRSKSRWRRWRVVGQSFAVSESPARRGIFGYTKTFSNTMVYSTASMHFTNRGARKAANALNRKAGTAQ